MPAVSVLMPVYNGERYVVEAVESILAQDFADYELIIVDDGSTDGTKGLLAGFKDPRVRVIRHDRNGGLSKAHNTGLKAARGDLVARMDADDVAHPERLGRQVAFMREHPECVLLGSAVSVLCPAGLPLYVKRIPCQHEEIARALWSGDSQAIVHPAVMMRRGAVERVGGYREHYATIEDIDLYLRLLPLGRAANLSEPLLGYRQHPGSTNAQKHEKQVGLMRELFAELGSQCPYPHLERPFLNGWPREPRVEALRRWGWNAVKRGRIEIAREYARAALRLAPASVQSWRLAYCALRGR